MSFTTPGPSAEAKDVLTVDDYGAIRRAGAMARPSARSPASSITRNTVRKILKHPEPEPVPATRDRFAPMLGPVQTALDQILRDDEARPPKQRHTAMQMFRRLRDEHGYRGGYAQVQRYALKHRREGRETFVPLGHLPGRRLEADFGHIHVDFPDGRRPVPFLVATWAYSNAPFVLALPFERTEAILEGMVAAFEFFGCAPREVWWDNARAVAALILRGRERRAQPRYAALASHYLFDPMFCMPARGNEKPDAESTVKAVQRRFATPVPRAADLAELNASLRSRCEAERSAHRPVALRGLRDRGAVRRGPRRGPAAAGAAVRRLRHPPRGRGRQVPDRRLRLQPLQRPAAVRVPDGDRQGLRRPRRRRGGGRVVATHARSLERHTVVLDPVHYLATLETKPGAIDHSPVYRDWKLPACFAGLPRRAGAAPRRAGRHQAVRAGPAAPGRAPPGAGRPGGRGVPSRAPRQRRGGHPAHALARRHRGDGTGRAGRSRPGGRRGAPGRRADARPGPLRSAPERSLGRGPGQRLLRALNRQRVMRLTGPPGREGPPNPLPLLEGSRRWPM